MIRAFVPPEWRSWGFVPRAVYLFMLIGGLFVAQKIAHAVARSLFGG